MSDVIRKQVQSIIDCASVKFSARYVTQTKRDDWDCDAWVCSFEYPGKPAQTFDFYTGLGLRAPATDWDKAQAKYGFPGLTMNDIGARNIYGRRYLAEVEKLRKPQAPHAADVLHSAILDMSASETSFNDWCADMGYSNDSIKALNTYRACQEGGEKLQKVFSRETLSALREVLQDY